MPELTSSSGKEDTGVRNEGVRRSVVGVGAVGLLVALMGCQSVPQGTGATAFDNESFMSLWTRYSRCQSGTDLSTMQVEARHLEQVAASTAQPHGFTLTLPKQVRRYVSEPLTRLAVDPKAMAAACMLYTGQIAADLGKIDVATTIFRSLLTHQAQPEYEYYVAQAREGLSQLELALKGGEGQARVVRTGHPAEALHAPANESSLH